LAQDFAPSIIDDSQIADYERDGVVCLRGLFDAAWVERLRAAVERRMAEARARAIRPGSHHSFMELFIWQVDPEFRAFVFESPAAAIAARMMDSKNVRFYFDQLFIKEPGMLSPSPWHHDQPFWPVKGTQVCSIWLALDPVTKASSGLEYVAGSHRWGKRFAPPTIPTSNIPGFAGDETQTPDIENNRCDYEFLNWDMQPGDCLVHHGLAMHGASGNSTLDIRRRALATRWLGDDIVYLDGGGHEPLRVAGLKTGDPLPDNRFPPVSSNDKIT